MRSKSEARRQAIQREGRESGGRAVQSGELVLCPECGLPTYFCETGEHYCRRCMGFVVEGKLLRTLSAARGDDAGKPTEP